MFMHITEHVETIQQNLEHALQLKEKENEVTGPLGFSFN